MISIERCKEILNDPNLSNEYLEQLRGSLYAISEKIISNYLRDNIDNDYGKNTESTHLLPSIIGKTEE
jgi:hypothetical protein